MALIVGGALRVVRAHQYSLFALTHSLALPTLLLACCHGIGGILEEPQVVCVVFVVVFFFFLLLLFFFVALFAHVAVRLPVQLWRWLIGPMALYVVERAARARAARKSHGVIVQAVQWADHSLEIVVACQPPTQFDAQRCGDVVYLAVDSGDAVGDDCNLHPLALATGDGFHPFSIKVRSLAVCACWFAFGLTRGRRQSPTHMRPQIALLIDVVGDWSRAVQRLVNPLNQRGVLDVGSLPAVRLTGPYPSVASFASDYGIVVALAAGSGISPFAGLMHAVAMRAVAVDR